MASNDKSTKHTEYEILTTVCSRVSDYTTVYTVCKNVHDKLDICDTLDLKFRLFRLIHD